MISVSGHNYSSMALTGASIQNKIDTSIQRLSSGQRINAAKDDVAGMQISTRLNAEIKGLEQASKHAADAQSLLDTAEGALREVEAHLLRIRELTVQSRNGTLSDTDKATLHNEAQQRIAAIDSISTNTSSGGINLLDGTFKDKSFQIDASSTNVVNTNIRGTSASDLDIEHFNFLNSNTTINVSDPVSNSSSHDLIISDNDEYLYFIDVDKKEFSGDVYHENTQYPFIKIRVFNTYTNIFEKEVEISRDADSNLAHLDGVSFKSGSLLKNGNIALAYT